MENEIGLLCYRPVQVSASGSAGTRKKGLKRGWAGEVDRSRRPPPQRMAIVVPCRPNTDSSTREALSSSHLPGLAADHLPLSASVPHLLNQRSDQAGPYSPVLRWQKPVQVMLFVSRDEQGHRKVFQGGNTVVRERNTCGYTRTPGPTQG